MSTTTDEGLNDPKDRAMARMIRVGCFLSRSTTALLKKGHCSLACWQRALLMFRDISCCWVRYYVSNTHCSITISILSHVLLCEERCFLSSGATYRLAHRTQFWDSSLSLLCTTRIWCPVTVGVYCLLLTITAVRAVKARPLMALEPSSFDFSLCDDGLAILVQN